MRTAIAELITAYREKRRLRRSLAASFIAGAGRDAFRFYENGRSVEVNVEMMSAGFPRRIYRHNLYWSDTTELLTDTKKAEVLSALCQYLDHHHIQWEFYGSDDET